MMIANRSPRPRHFRPIMVALEDRALLTAAVPRVAHLVPVEARAITSKAAVAPLATTSPVTLAGGYKFRSFDGPAAGTNAGSGTNINGISNNGTVVGFTVDNNGNNTNFTARPTRSSTATVLSIGSSPKATALAINSSGTVVGTDGNGNAFTLSRRTVRTLLPTGASSAVALGINDRGTIVGQGVVGSVTTGVIRVRANNFITINAPAGASAVSPQGINNNGLVVGFAVGADGQDHGLVANQRAARKGVLTATAVADPTIPTVAGEPGATFVFSQILGVNDRGIAVGYYGDSTGSQHGFLYNTRTGVYTFRDDPNVAFNNGVETTQITGITNSGEIAGFYSDANGVLHGFTAVR